MHKEIILKTSQRYTAIYFIELKKILFERIFKRTKVRRNGFTLRQNDWCCKKEHLIEPEMNKALSVKERKELLNVL